MSDELKSLMGCCGKLCETCGDTLNCPIRTAYESMKDEVYDQGPTLTHCPECHAELETERVCKHCHPGIYKAMTRADYCMCQKCGFEFESTHLALIYEHGTFTRAAKPCPTCGWRHYVIIVGGPHDRVRSEGG